MKLNKKIIFLAFICLAFSVLAACSDSTTISQGDSSEIIVSQTPSKVTPVENIADKTINLLLVSMGQTDDELVNILGEGTVIIDEDKRITNRIYERILLDEAVSISVNLSPNNTVISAELNLTSGTFEDWQKKLTDILGEPTILDEASSISIAEWNLSCAVTTLQQEEILQLFFIALPT
ncbi:MAG: hypothetical protein RSB96_00440 [Oscillospiraceae bacterium]